MWEAPRSNQSNALLSARPASRLSQLSTLRLMSAASFRRKSAGFRTADRLDGVRGGQHWEQIFEIATGQKAEILTEATSSFVYRTYLYWF
jgi:hypothetical protein